MSRRLPALCCDLACLGGETRLTDAGSSRQDEGDRGGPSKPGDDPVQLDGATDEGYLPG